MRSNDQVMRGGRKSFTNAFSSNLNTKSEIFPRTWWETRLNEKQSLPVYRIMDQIMDLSLTPNWAIDILFDKLTLQIGD